MRDSVLRLRVPVRVPYRLDLTATVLRRLSTNVVDVFDGQTYRRMLGDPATPALMEVTQIAPDALDVVVHGDARTDVALLVRRMLGTDVDLAPWYAAAAEIPWLHAIAERARGVKSPRYPSLWESIVNAVVYQQVSIHAAGAILRRVIEHVEPLRDTNGLVLAPFPAPQLILDVDPTVLRTLGLSINKVVALRVLARAVLDGELDEAALELLATRELVTQLETFRGIGPWTAAVIALRGFGRLDIFPMKDSGVARSLKDLSGDAAVDAEAIVTALGAQRGMLYYHVLLGRLAARGDIDLG